MSNNSKFIYGFFSGSVLIGCIWYYFYNKNNKPIPKYDNSIDKNNIRSKINFYHKWKINLTKQV